MDDCDDGLRILFIRGRIAVLDEMANDHWDALVDEWNVKELIRIKRAEIVAAASSVHTKPRRYTKKKEKLEEIRKVMNGSVG